MDAKRIGKSGMKEMMVAEKLEEALQKFALYQVELC